MSKNQDLLLNLVTSKHLWTFGNRRWHGRTNQTFYYV